MAAKSAWVFVLLLGLIGLCAPAALAQQDPVRPDTVSPQRVVTPVPVTPEAASGKPARSDAQKVPNRQIPTILSAVAPGLGQIYNGRIWKVPIIYAIGGGLAYLAITNHNNYACFRDAAQLYGAMPDSIRPGIAEVCGRRYTMQGIRANRDFYRRNRDLSIIFVGITYMLNIVDANVDAHMKGFDVSEDLSMQISPFVVPTHAGVATGLNLTFNFRK